MYDLNTNRLKPSNPDTTPFTTSLTKDKKTVTGLQFEIPNRILAHNADYPEKTAAMLTAQWCRLQDEPDASLLGYLKDKAPKDAKTYDTKDVPAFRIFRAKKGTQQYTAKAGNLHMRVIMPKKLTGSLTVYLKDIPSKNSLGSVTFPVTDMVSQETAMGHAVCYALCCRDCMANASDT